MQDPLPRSNNSKPGFHYSGGGYGQRGTGSYANNNNSMQVKRNKPDYCWNFNKGVPCKFGAKCRLIERCKYCDSPSHGVNACVKLQKKGGSTVNSGNSNNKNSGGLWYFYKSK